MNCFERIDRATFVRCYVATEVNRREARQNGERPSGFTVDRASYNWSCVHRPCRMLSKKTKKYNDCNADGRNSWSVMRAERSLRPSLSANLFPWTLIRKRQIKQPTSVELKRVTLQSQTLTVLTWLIHQKHLQLVRYGSRSSWTRWGFVAWGWHARLRVHRDPQTAINPDPVIK